MPQIMEYLTIDYLISLIFSLKWLIFPVTTLVLFLFFKDSLLYWRQSIYKSKLEWQFLELRVPREIKKGPKAMEQFFNALHGLMRTKFNIFERWLDGQVSDWFSFEIVAENGMLRFVIRLPKGFRKTIESMLYAQYPDLEIVETKDYTDEVPNTLEKLNSIGLELWGNEILLVKPNPYPIITYQVFEEISGEERIIDPISLVHEVAGKLKDGERIWIQILVRTADSSWVKQGQVIMEELKNKISSSLTSKDIKGVILSPREEEILKFVGRKISKPGFETLIRYIYIAPKELFNRDLPVAGIFSYFGQYRSEALNNFSSNWGVRTDVSWKYFPYFFVGRRLRNRKKKILDRFRKRYFPEETFTGRLVEADFWYWQFNKKASISILNSEELATLYHFPTNVVLTAPFLERVESKKISPPFYIPY